MLKNISKLGSVLNKQEQKIVKGGYTAPVERCHDGWEWAMDYATGSWVCIPSLDD
ncbi:hypothetical protein [Tenacibaculum caenipelagi]|uniref:Uncharacterized protein n=1 Tax=Tenacibaculum caenipelagi TaxID=1325435 RepID=A0A4R6THM6_9FLAO|nr:hypothetical protein [Tenacibaculum caenipelagi]TDQ28686.1 hypothetical protein DFQ07_1064 [Tenacibaculum caenipelagi]